MNSEYITGIDVFSNRTDYGTLVPFLKHVQKRQQTKYEKVTADAGYESLENYLFLEQNGQISFIKPANYEARKTKCSMVAPGKRSHLTIFVRRLTAISIGITINVSSYLSAD